MGTNDSFYYGITTTITDQSNTETTYDSLISNESSIYDPIVEVTTPVRTPYNLMADFDPTTSITTLSWINYNDIFYVLPETGPDAYQTRIWMSTQPITRSSAGSLFSSMSPVAQLISGVDSYEIFIPQDTDRDVYTLSHISYQIISALQDYEDIRFLSNNELDSTIAEDNMPASPVTSVNTFCTRFANR